MSSKHRHSNKPLVEREWKSGENSVEALFS